VLDLVRAELLSACAHRDADRDQQCNGCLAGDEIAAALTAVRGLSVAARSSSFQLDPNRGLLRPVAQPGGISPQTPGRGCRDGWTITINEEVSFAPTALGTGCPISLIIGQPSEELSDTADELSDTAADG
jgi:hypothetical protein